MNLSDFEEQARGWIPQTPKTKKKHKRMYASAAFLFSTVVLVSVFSSAFFVQVSAPSAAMLPAYVHVSTSSPFSTYVEFQGILDTGGESYVEINGVRQEIEQSFHIIFTDGSKANTKALNLSFSTNAKSYADTNFQVHVAVTGDNFTKEKTLDATMVSGKLTVNSKTSLFMLDPHLLVKGTQIQLGEAPDWKLLGDISNSTWGLQTAIEDYRVEAVGVLAYHSTAIAPKGWLMLNLGYDTQTGMLVSVNGALTDVLLDAAGIELIMNGMFGLVSYSENLNLEVVKLPENSVGGGFPLWIIWATAVPIVIGVIAVLAYRAYRRKNNLAFALGSFEETWGMKR
jgi:hypothetical protein